MRRLRARVLAGLVAAGTALAAAPAAGAQGIDPTFGSAGISINSLSATGGDRYQATAAAPDGGNYNAGYTTVSGTNRAFVVTKTDAAGRLDPNFGSGGVAVIDVAPGPFIDGPVPPAGGAPQAGPNGSAETAKGIAVQADGKIVVLGQAETVQDGSKPDSRDLDAYVVRLRPSGQRDASFGTLGVVRVDLSDGVGQYLPSATTTVPTTDQAAYSVHVRADGKVVFAASQGLDSGEAARADREIAAVQLNADGSLDGSFGSGGIGVAQNLKMGAPINENLRGSLLDPNGKLVVATYSNVISPPNTTGLNRPFIFRFDADGSLDSTFGANGVASELVAGPAPGMAEAYGVAMQGNRYVVTGYGIRSTTPENSVDAIGYRFNYDGSWDQSFGTDGLASYNRRENATTSYQDRSRNHVVLPDGRIVIAGTSGPEGLMLVLTPEGQPDTTVSPDGGFLFDLGGNADTLWGIATVGDGYRVVGAGYAATNGASDLDDSALARLDLSTPPVLSDPPPAVSAPPVAGPSQPPTQRLARKVGKVSVSCSLTNEKAGKVRCAITQQNVGQGKAKLSLKRLGVKHPKTVSNQGKVNKKGKSVVTLTVAGPGRYSATIKLPTPAGNVQTIKRTITVS